MVGLPDLPYAVVAVAFSALVVALILYMSLQTRWFFFVLLSLVFFMLGNIAFSMVLPLYQIFFVVASASLFLGVESLASHLSVVGKAERVRGIMDSVQGSYDEKSQDEMLVLKTYNYLTNKFLYSILYVVGKKKAYGVLRDWRRESGYRLEFMRDGGVYIHVPKDEKMKDILHSFFQLNTKLLGLYASVTSMEKAKEVFLGVFGTSAGSYGEVLYSYGLPTILIKSIFDPLLEKCSGSTRETAKEVLKKVDTALEIEDGRISLGGVYEKIANLPPDDKVKYTKSVTSTLIKRCYPLLVEDLGVEKAELITSKSISELLKQHGAILSNYGITDVIPEGFATGMHRIRAGKCYLVKDTGTAFNILNEMMGYGFQGLLITRDLDRMQTESVIWLGKRAPRDDIAATDKMAELMKHIENFTKSKDSTIVLLDGAEYLATRHDFSMVLKFLHDLKEVIARHGSRLLLPINPAALSERDVALLERDFEKL